MFNSQWNHARNLTSKNCRPCWYTKLHFGKNHVDSKEGLARLRSSAHYMWNMLRCCCWLKFCLLLLLFFSHTKVFFTSAEIARRHISTQPENCSTRFLSKSKICKKGIFCKNPSIVVFPQTFECQKSLLSREVKIAIGILSGDKWLRNAELKNSANVQHCLGTKYMRST